MEKIELVLMDIKNQVQHLAEQFSEMKTEMKLLSQAVEELGAAVTNLQQSSSSPVIEFLKSEREMMYQERLKKRELVFRVLIALLSGGSFLTWLLQFILGK